MTLQFWFEERTSQKTGEFSTEDLVEELGDHKRAYKEAWYKDHSNESIGTRAEIPQAYQNEKIKIAYRTREIARYRLKIYIVL